MKYFVSLTCIFFALNAGAEEIPFPSALDAAAVVESRISDLKREALVLGNGDLNALLWERDGALCLRVTKNDIWDARIDTSRDPELMTMDIAKRTWQGGAHFETASSAVREVDLSTLNTSAWSARLDLRRATATLEHDRKTTTVIRALADRDVFLIEGPGEVSLEEVPASYLPSAELGVTDGVKWLHMVMPGDVDYQGMEYALAVAAHGDIKAVSVVTSFDTRRQSRQPGTDPKGWSASYRSVGTGPLPMVANSVKNSTILGVSNTEENVRAAAIRAARETLAAKPAELIQTHEAAWSTFWSATGLQLGDPFFQDAWYRNMYYMRCLCRPFPRQQGPAAYASRLTRC